MSIPNLPSPSLLASRTTAGRARLLGAASLVALSAIGLLFSHCFTPTYSDCAFRCASEDPRCPPGYECRSDNYCHLPDSTNICLFGIDLAGLTLDAGVRPDL